MHGCEKIGSVNVSVKENQKQNKKALPSGAMKAGVPHESVRILPRPETPKSAIFTVPSLVRSIFDGLRSLWVMKLLCRYSNPFMT